MAGAPQLIIPRSHDQPDNASRVAKLGIGKALSYRKIDRAGLSATLSELIASQRAASRSKKFQARMLATDTLSEVCEWTEEIAKKYPKGGREHVKGAARE